MPVEFCNETTRSITQVDALQDDPMLPLTQAYDGTGVLVGVVDEGFNFRHPSFLNADSTLAVEYYDEVWGQDSFKVYNSSQDIYAMGHSWTDGSHGTHVLGIAAGRGVDGHYRDMAPKARIALSSDSQNETAAFLRLYEYARRKHLPMVVNFSAGLHIPYGLENDFALQHQIIDSIASQPGFILVAAAGNEGMEEMYRRKWPDVEQQDTLTTTNSRLAFGLRTKGRVYIQLMVENNDGVKDTLSLRSDSIFNNMYIENLKNTGVTFAAFKQDSIYKSITFIALNSSDSYSSAMPRFIVKTWGDAAEMSTYSGTTFSSHGEQAHQEGTITYPAIYKNVIAVGATERCENLTNYLGEDINYGAYDGYMNDVTPWSSCGAEWDSIVKPDVVAPGTNIISALDYKERSKAKLDGKSLIVEMHKDGAMPYGWVCKTGTSMAAPAVTGIISLWLQADSTLTAERIRDIFRRTSTHINTSVDYPNNIYGAGEINAYRGLIDILGLTTKIEDLSQQPLPSSRLSINNGALTVDLDVPATIRIYNTSGVLVSSTGCKAGKATIDMGGRHGVFVVQVSTGNTKTSASQLVRL